MTDPPPTLQERIYSLLDRHPVEPSTELLDLLAQWWTIRGTQFDTKMEAWKALRIKDMSWDPPVFEFTIERHPGAWEREQRWAYDFDTNEAELLFEWSLRKNERYTAQQAAQDAEQIVKHIVEGSAHPCVQPDGGLIRIRLARLPSTRPVPYVLPRRTAQGRQTRLKAEVARLMEGRSDFERVAGQETRGSLCYRRL